MCFQSTKLPKTRGEFQRIGTAYKYFCPPRMGSQTKINHTQVDERMRGGNDAIDRNTYSADIRKTLDLNA